MEVCFLCKKPFGDEVNTLTARGLTSLLTACAQDPEATLYLRNLQDVSEVRNKRHDWLLTPCRGGVSGIAECVSSL